MALRRNGNRQRPRRQRGELHLVGIHHQLEQSHRVVSTSLFHISIDQLSGLNGLLFIAYK